MIKFSKEQFAEACAATFVIHSDSEESLTYHEICKGSLIRFALSELGPRYFMYFCKLIGISERIQLEHYINIGNEFDKLVKFSDVLPPDIELLSSLSFKTSEEIRKISAIQIVEY